jgi:WD40 repeat protein
MPRKCYHLAAVSEGCLPLHLALGKQRGRSITASCLPNMVSMACTLLRSVRMSGTATFNSKSTFYYVCSAGRVFFWELVEAALVQSFQAHTGVVCGLAMHPSEACLVTCSVDATVKVWR